MSTSNVSISQALGQGFEYRVPDTETVYRLAPWTFEIRGYFEQYVQRAVLEAANLLDRSNPAAADAARARIVADIGLGLYAWGSDNISKALDARQHIQYIIYLQIKKNHPEVTLDLVKKLYLADLRGLSQAALLANGIPIDPEKKEEEGEEGNG
jgi:hypothetical protein